MRKSPATVAAEEADYVRRSVSLPKLIFKKGERIAKQRSRTFSNYVKTLIDADK